MNIEALTHHIAHLKETNILVSASAGAGKTTLLIKRLMTRIVEDRISVNQICALTFSEAAAHEMKDRLKLKLREKLAESQDFELSSFIKEQLSLIDTAMISTIHSFALSLIKDFSYVLNLDPEMSKNVLDDGTSKLLFSECSDEVIQKAIHNHPQSIQSLQSLVSTSSFDFSTLKEIIQEIYQVRRLQIDLLSFDNRVRYLHEDPLSIIQPLLCEELSHQFIEAIAISDKVIFQGSNAGEDMKNVEILRSILSNMHDKIRNNELKEVLAQLHTEWVPAIPKIRDHELYNDAKKELQDCIKDLVNAFNDLNEHVLHVQSLLPHINVVIDLVKDLTALMHSKKSSLKVIEFDDMERLAYEILTHPDYDVPSFYQSRYTDILVDEFQDTNDLQNQIITLISTGNNVFRVGDVKQSIYRFRGAKPQLMRSMVNDPKIEVFTLPHNFRSSEPIVEFNNTLFSTLMNVGGFNDVYKDQDKVTVGRDAQRLITSPVTFLKVNKPDKDMLIEAMDDEIDNDNEESKEEGENFKTKSYETAADHIKARVITKNIIERHLNQNIPFRDMCVLVKSHAQKDILKKLFDEKGIPHFINSPQGFLKHPTITQVLMFAQYCLFPNDFYLSGVLLSDYTSLTTDDVAQLKLQGNLETALINQYPEIHASLVDLKHRVLTNSLASAIHECLKYSDFYHRCDSQGKLNGDALVQRAVDFEKSHQGGLAAFIQSLEHLKDAKIAEAMDVALSDDVVKVMTIHASKGLQFPIVYVFNDESTMIHASRGQVIVDPNFGFTLRIKQDYNIEVTNIVRKALLYVEKKAAYEESLRLWYVALTRAEKEMVCIGINKETKTYSTKLHASTVLKSKGINGLLLGLQTFFQKSLLSTHEIEDPNRAAIVSLKLKEVEDIKALPLLQVTKQASIPLTPLDTSNRLKPKEVGSLIHSILERCVLSNNPIQDIQSMSLDLSTAQKEGMISFFTHPLTQHWNEFQKQSEFPIITKNETGYHQYYLDLLMKKDDEWIIVDFKTDKVTHVEQLKERYASQLLSYDQALRSYAPSLKTYIYSIVLKEAILINE
ncbi:MAG: UvrD-helicase domain-containing protein [Erysipelothrix sp.]|nr:UvrD-helicase domain-containing protein [Erysipelothrix sp.]